MALFERKDPANMEEQKEQKEQSDRMKKGLGHNRQEPKKTVRRMREARSALHGRRRSGPSYLLGEKSL